jgi:putative transposase
MGQSLARNYVHIVFSTKFRQPLLIQSIESQLYAYVGGICKNLGCHPIAVNGHKDHVHVLCELSKTVALTTLVKEVKCASSQWIKTRDTHVRNFYWQNGYAALSVSATAIEIVKRYIENQHEHHATKTFQEEYRVLLKEYKIEYDERYVWD